MSQLDPITTWTAREVSEETGIPIGTVSSVLRARINDGQAVKATTG